jgi:putative nucleotide binding protein
MVEQQVEHEHEGLEEYALVLDYLSTGKSFSPKPEPLVQLLGETKFTLLEAVPKVSEIRVREKVYIGKGERDKIALIKSRIMYNDLTQVAKNELPGAIVEILKQNEAKFVNIFNTASPLNIRMHSLELLPGVGKKHLNAILKARDEKEFTSFKDISERVPLLQDPIKLLTERIIEELKGESRFYMLARPYSRELGR